jgi:hypothetical protein
MDMRRPTTPYLQIRSSKVSWPAELSMLDQVLRPRKHANIALLITVPYKSSALTFYHAKSVHDCRAMQDDDWR